MDLRQLRYFLAIIQNRSLGRAAEVLNVSQPALSKAISRLEAELGVKLLERLPRGVNPTTCGEALAAHANLIGMELDRAKMAINAMRDGKAGRVVIGAGSSLTIEVLPTACTRLRERVPGVEIKVVGALYEDVVPDLIRGNLDLVLSMVPEHVVDKGLVHEPLYLDQVHPCVCPAHPLLSKPNLRPEDTLEYGWVLPPQNNLPRQHLNALFISRGLPAPTKGIESNSTLFTLGAVARSKLIGWLPTQVISQGDSRPVVPLPIPEITLSRAVGITYRRASVLTPVMVLLIEELKGASGEMIALGTVSHPQRKTHTHEPKL